MDNTTSVLHEVKEFCNETSIHGLGQIANDRAWVIKRLLWFGVVVTCFIYAGYQLSFKIEVWIEEPTMEILESTSYSVGNVDFPTVTICPKSSNPDRWGPVMKIFDHLNVVCSDKSCSAEQENFQDIGLKVNKFLREKVRTQEGVKMLDRYYGKKEEHWSKTMRSFLLEPMNAELFAKLLSNETNHQLFMDRIWKQFGNFSSENVPILFQDYFNNGVKKIDKIMDELSMAVQNIDEKCSKIDPCYKKIEGSMRSIYALSYLASVPPKSPGQYLSYHREMFDDAESNYMNEDKEWPNQLACKPGHQSLLFNKYFEKVVSELSSGEIKGESILDMPGFGSMIDSFEYNLDWNYPWSNQLNMALYNYLTSENNFSWTNNSHTEIDDEGRKLKKLWKLYMKEPETNISPYNMQKNNFFNFTDKIDRNLPRFLKIYASSFRTNTNQNTTMTFWRDLARKLFQNLIKIESTDFIKNPGYYENLIMDCVFREPLLSHKPNLIESCGELYHSLTSNGVCHSFNGYSVSKLWKDSRIVQSFGSIFEGSKEEDKKFRGVGSEEGLNLVINMDSFVNLTNNGVPNTPYTIKISSKLDMVDQKRGLIEVRPGYNVVIRVIPKVVDTTAEFEKFDVRTRKCKLPHETNGLKLTNNYSKNGCEFECAVDQALAKCKCLPWYYPNNFTGTPMCDMFGGKCFDTIMADERHYQKCNRTCLEDCKGTTYVALPSLEPIHTKEFCGLKQYVPIWDHLYMQYSHINWFNHLTKGEPLKGKMEWCQEYVLRYISIVSIETPTNSVTKSERVRRKSLDDKLSDVGGILGLFSGISVLSMVEVVCFCFGMTKKLCWCGKDKILIKETYESGRNEQPNKEEKANVEAFLAETMERATQPMVSQNDNDSLSEKS